MKQSIINIVSLSALTVAGLALGACAKGDKSNSEAVAEPTGEANERAPTQTMGAQPASGAPGKLRTIMIDLDTEIGALQSGLWLENFDLISASALKIANHPKVSDAEKMRVKTAMGADMPAFVAMDKMVHEEALTLSEAATSKDMAKTLESLAALQKNCVTCHSVFRSRLTTSK